LDDEENKYTIYLGSAVVCGAVQRGPSLFVGDVQGGTTREEEVQHLEVPFGARPVNRGIAVRVRDLRVVREPRSDGKQT
jgi:hypothetical protein